MNKRNRRLTAEQKLFRGFMLGSLAVCAFIATAILVVWDITHTFTVYQSHETGDVVEIRDWRGNPAPDEGWDFILAGKHAKVLVP
ncbi:MAG: hypothetical protein AAB891_01050 [Patescibacteria group bacterium]